MRDVAVTAVCFADYRGFSSDPPSEPDPGAAALEEATLTPGRLLRGIPADPGVLEDAARNVAPRHARYLGRNVRLAIASCSNALRSCNYPEDATSREGLACWVATGRGPSDPATSASIARDAVRRRANGTLPSAAAALETYTSRRQTVQYLLSMEPAVVGQVAAALELHGPAHTIAGCGVEGGHLAILRAAWTVARGDASAALACAVTTAEDAPALAERLSPRESSTVVLEAAAAAVIEPVGLSRRHRPIGRRLLLDERRVSGMQDPKNGVYVGGPGAFWELAHACDHGGPGEAVHVVGPGAYR